ncbi:hypothetical protein EKO27_g8500 [Xylaria grammica]|uniref:Alpha-ketoglutarate-dependent dioxygenase AlkB-like domain-containing protein n=1 Tax=Xylaria grammica TaxID=363999 RepID=A0A439CWL6_9PEZI|nr:hypothetical protein EKO27_g8500 [Xylaria grammica]
MPASYYRAPAMARYDRFQGVYQSYYGNRIHADSGRRPGPLTEGRLTIPGPALKKMLFLSQPSIPSAACAVGIGNVGCGREEILKFHPNHSSREEVLLPLTFDIVAKSIWLIRGRVPLAHVVDIVTESIDSSVWRGAYGRKEIFNSATPQQASILWPQHIVVHRLSDFRLEHGDMVIMHGTKIHKTYEHSVIAAGVRRYALTCRYIRPETIPDAARREKALVNRAVPAGPEQQKQAYKEETARTPTAILTNAYALSIHALRIPWKWQGIRPWIRTRSGSWNLAAARFQADTPRRRRHSCTGTKKRPDDSAQIRRLPIAHNAGNIGDLISGRYTALHYKARSGVPARRPWRGFITE